MSSKNKLSSQIESQQTTVEQNENPIIHQINIILQGENKEQKKEELKKLYIKLIKDIKKKVEIAKEIPQILEVIFNNLNKISKNIHTKKLYKYPYDKTYKYFSNLSTYQKIRELLIPIGKNDLNETQYNGGNCHNWNLLYNDFLEILTPKFIIFEKYSAHSILVIEINNETYIADSNDKEKFNIKKINIGDELNIGNHYIAKVSKLNPISFNIIYNGSIEENNYDGKIFQNNNDFINYLDEKDKNYFLLEYNFYDNNNEKHLISFLSGIKKDKFYITIEGILKKEKTIELKKQKIKGKSNKEIINFLFNKTNNKLNKNQQKILDGIIGKIPEGYLYYLITKKKNK